MRFERKPVRVEVWWNDQDPNNEGCYASRKVWFSVDVDDYGPDDEDALLDALAEVYLAVQHALANPEQSIVSIAKQFNIATGTLRRQLRAHGQLPRKRPNERRQRAK